MLKEVEIFIYNSLALCFQKSQQNEETLYPPTWKPPCSDDLTSSETRIRPVFMLTSSLCFTMPKGISAHWLLLKETETFTFALTVEHITRFWGSQCFYPNCKGFFYVCLFSPPSPEKKIQLHNTFWILRERKYFLQLLKTCNQLVHPHQQEILQERAVNKMFMKGMQHKGLIRIIFGLQTLASAL